MHRARIAVRRPESVFLFRIETHTLMAESELFDGSELVFDFSAI
jgi:hypothetical protein